MCIHSWLYVYMHTAATFTHTYSWRSVYMHTAEGTAHGTRRAAPRGRPLPTGRPSGTCLPFPQEALGLSRPHGPVPPELLPHVAVTQLPQGGRQRPVQPQQPAVEAPRAARPSRHGGGGRAVRRSRCRPPTGRGPAARASAAVARGRRAGE